MKAKTVKASGIRYPPISDYGFIADCHSAALVSRDGSIDWCCMPRIDSSSCFGRMLGWDTGGFCRIAPETTFRSRRRYLDDTLVLETTFTSHRGTVRLIDLFPLRRGGRQDPHQQLIRIIEGVHGEVRLAVEIVPRFEYGAIRPWIKHYRKDAFIAIGGCDGLLISGDIVFEQPDRHCLCATPTVTPGQRLRLSLLYRPPKMLDDEAISIPGSEELDRRLNETLDLWHAWSSKAKLIGSQSTLVRRSAMVLKGLTHAPTGAIAAAATSSLPEAWQGRRNWDYRFTWIRDSVFTLRSLGDIGYYSEADEFRKFIERTAAGSADDLQIMFGVGGERRLEEYVVDLLEGYRGARPVRFGNAAYRQMQFDIFGELMQLAWQWHQGGCSPDDDYWEFLVEVVEAAARNWHRKDHGIWEMRGRRRHFVFSKVMCWSAVDKGIALAEELGRPIPEGWRRLRDKIRSKIETKGYDEKRGIFVQHFGGQELDAALLRMPMTGFIDYNDPRMIRTVEAIRSELGAGGLVLRYARSSDGFAEPEGVFIACSFWLAECLSRQGRLKDAQRIFGLALATANDLGLFSEQYDPAAQEMMGNFPQGLTHLSLVSAALALERVEESNTDKRH